MSGCDFVCSECDVLPLTNKHSASEHGLDATGSLWGEGEMEENYSSSITYVFYMQAHEHHYLPGVTSVPADRSITVIF